MLIARLTCSLVSNDDPEDTGNSAANRNGTIRQAPDATEDSADGLTAPKPR